MSRIISDRRERGLAIADRGQHTTIIFADRIGNLRNHDLIPSKGQFC